MRPDGSETVRLLDDAPKDRNPTWSPDGNRVAFMSTRSGAWELWSVRRDGSDLRQMTDFKSSVYEAVWSSDGKRAMTADTVSTSLGQARTWLFDTDNLATKANAQLIAPASTDPFSVESWSPDMTRVAGAIIGPDGLARAAAWLDLATETVRRMDVPVLPGQDYRIIAGWLPDSRRFLVPTPGGLAIVDADTGKWATVEAPLAGTRYRLSRDARKLMVEREVYDGDVWLLEMKPDR
jgi:Tol biopolymer transport system component